jgi:hypothetical protein
MQENMIVCEAHFFCAAMAHAACSPGEQVERAGQGDQAICC